MNEEQSMPEKTTEEGDDTSKVFLGDTTLQSKDENDMKDNVDYYEVDNPKKEISTTIGDGEMRNEGTVGEGNVSEDNPFSAEGLSDNQDEALQDSGN